MKNQPLFAIGIPTINRADLLQETLEKYAVDFPNTAIYIVDNGFQSFDTPNLGQNIHFIANSENIGVAASWNQLLDKIYNGIPGVSKPCTFAMVLNDDIYLGKTEAQVSEFILGTLFYFATGSGTWCAWIMQKIIFNKVGPFDEKFFPAYFEDNDYAYRLTLAGFPHQSFQFLDPEIYRNSQTIAKDSSLNGGFAHNRKYFIDKWGGEPMKETYLTPFNQQL